MAAGLYFMTIPFYLWLLYFGCEPDSKVREFLDGRGYKLHFPGARSAGVAGLEEGLQVGQTPALRTPMVSSLNVAAPQTDKAPSMTALASPTAGQDVASDGVAELQAIGKARCLYSYEASPDDPNEISFAKGQVLEIMNDKGKWWQVRKTLDNGQSVIGIIPSNYVERV
jgi:SHO1 osmosensor